MIRSGLIATLLLAIGAPSSHAQDADESRTWPPWRTSYFPYVTASPNDGAMGVARWITFRQADYDDRVSLRSAIAVEAGYSTRGSRFGSIRVDFPRAAEGWRLAGSARAGKQVHFGVPDGDIDRVRYTGWGEVTRRLGPLQLAVRLAADHTALHGDVVDLGSRYPYAPSNGCTVEQLCFATDGLRQDDGQLRGALVLDLRDREYDPRRGALIEAGGFVGTAADGYHGGYAMGSGWFTPREGTRITARAGLRAMSSAGAIAALHEIPAWERPITVLGGISSHRALGEGEQVGRGVLLAGMEVRHDVMNFGAIGAFSVLGFVDGGRVFSDLSPLADPDPTQAYNNGDLRLTVNDWTWGVGGGFSLRILRAAQLTMTVGRAEGRTRVYVGAGTAW
ncbi:MAG: hypothetical protein ABIR59_05745 [Gemmatimonadales bacterium]